MSGKFGLKNRSPLKMRSGYFRDDDGDDGNRIEMTPMIQISKEEADMEIDASDIELEELAMKYQRKHQWKKPLRVFAYISVMVLLLCLAGFSLFHSAEHRRKRSPKTLSQVPVHAAFGLTQSKYLPTHEAMVHIYKHRKTQAEFMAFIPTDENQDKVFGISFRTKPTSHNGVAHILEHSVLSGSKKYPVKDPFLILQKGSLRTFLNAMTYNDRTVYPVASRNKKDFMNLMNVYLDAVFAPRCVTKEGDWVLTQEGWRYDVDEDDNLELRGVVYSEMKGAFSNPLSLLSRYSDRFLFPDNTYHWNSGGDPEFIPSLTQAEFVDFYERHYHPTNSQSFVSGTVQDAMDVMGAMDSYMKEYEHNPSAKKDSEIQFQKKNFDKHLYQSLPYAVQKDDVAHMLSITWLLNDSHMAPKLELSFYVLDYLLIGTLSSRLYKTLAESELGTSVIGGGLSTGLLQSTFAIGMRGVKEENLSNLETLIFDVLRGIVKNGFAKDEIEAAMNSIEFQLREVHSDSDPYGIDVFLGTLSTWNYDRSPLEAIDYEKPWKALKETAKQRSSGYFVRLIKEYLLENNHRVHVELRPSPNLEEDMIEKEREMVKKFQSSLTKDELTAVKEKAKHLETVQNTDDPPSVVSLVPSLALSDIDRSGVEYDVEVVNDAYGTSTMLAKHVAGGSAQIVYIDVGIDISSVEYHNVQMLPYIVSMLNVADTEDNNRTVIDRLIGMHTGGISVELSFFPRYDPGQDDYIASDNMKMQSFLFFRGKCAADKTEKLLSLIKEVAQKSLPITQEKAIQMFRRKINAFESSIASSGHLFSLKRMNMNYDSESFLSEKMSGISQLQFLKEMVDKAENNWVSVEKRIKNIMNSFSDMQSADTVINLTGDAPTLESIDGVVKKFVLSLDTSKAKQQKSYEVEHHWLKMAAADRIKVDLPKNEGIVISSQVSYTGMGGMLFNEGEKVSGATCVPLQYVKKGYLWEVVRMKNGAYGAMASLTQTDGTLFMISYRDPEVEKTIEAYNDSGQVLADDIQNNLITEETIKTAVIGCIGAIDGSALPPSSSGWLAFTRFMSGGSSARRQKWRDEILSAKKSDFEDFSKRLKVWKDRSSIAVVGSKSALTEATEGNGLSLDIINL